MPRPGVGALETPKAPGVSPGAFGDLTRGQLYDVKSPSVEKLSKST